VACNKARWGTSWCARRTTAARAAVIGKENGVDEFGFAPRKLGNKGHVQRVFLQASEQLVQPHLGFGVVQFLSAEPVAQRLDAYVHRIAQRCSARIRQPVWWGSWGQLIR